MQVNIRNVLRRMPNVFHWSIQWDVIWDKSIKTILTVQPLKLWITSFLSTRFHSGSLLPSTCWSNRDWSSLRQQQQEPTCPSFFTSDGIVIVPVDLSHFLPINLDDLFTKGARSRRNRRRRGHDIPHGFTLNWFRWWWWWWISRSFDLIGGILWVTVEPIDNEENRDQRDEGETVSSQSNRHSTFDALRDSISYLEENSVQMVARCNLF